MKRIILLLCSVSLISFFYSCKEKSRQELSTEFQSQLTEGDTLEVLKQGNQFMDLLKAQKTDEALSMLYEYDSKKDEMKELGAGTREQYLVRFRTFPMEDYLMQRYEFTLPMENSLRYNMRFRIKTINGEETGVTALMFNPVKYNGKWYLTIPLHQDVQKDSIQ